MIKLGCIADDFTGATDLGGLLTRAGARVSLYLGVPDDEVECTTEFAIIALKCRTTPVDEAVNEVEQAALWLQRQGAEQLYWKYCSTFDSTATGNIGPVAEKLLEITQQTQALYCPAFPENGRSIFKGYLFVGDQLLSESPLKDHPLTPMKDANLVRVLQPQVRDEVGLWQHSQIHSDHPLPTARHIIADAIEFNDLELIIKRTWGKLLLTGGSALAMPIPQLLAQTGELKQHQHSLPSDLSGDAVILAGSCSAQTRLQIEQYTQGPAYRIDPLVLRETGIEPIWDWWCAQDRAKASLIYASADPTSVAAVQHALGHQAAGELVENALAELALRMFAFGVSKFVVAGGETSGAISKGLGVTELEVGQEIAPGVPWCFARIKDRSVALALKSGNFGGERFFTDALEKIDG